MATRRAADPDLAREVRQVLSSTRGIFDTAAAIFFPGCCPAAQPRHCPGRDGNGRERFGVLLSSPGGMMARAAPRSLVAFPR